MRAHLGNSPNAVDLGMLISCEVCVLLVLTCDAASANILLVRHLMEVYSHVRTVLVMVAVVLCTAHQCHLCSRTLYDQLALHADRSVVSDVAASAHIFNQSSYYSRIFSAAVEILADVTVMTVEEARAQNLTGASEEQSAMHVALMSDVMLWA